MFIIPNRIVPVNLNYLVKQFFKRLMTQNLYTVISYILTNISSIVGFLQVFNTVESTLQKINRFSIGK